MPDRLAVTDLPHTMIIVSAFLPLAIGHRESES
jgi:uncharacterized protein YceK